MNEATTVVVGNLTGDPELRFLPGSGDAMCKFTVASTPRMFDRKTDSYRDGEPLFLSCTAWRQLAENIAESLSKGTRVVVSGRLRQSRWDDKETGEKRSMIALDVDEIGPSLRFATATVRRMARTTGSDGFVPADAPDDAWSSAKPATSAA